MTQWPLIIGGIVPIINVPGIEAGKLALDGETLAANSKHATVVIKGDRIIDRFLQSGVDDNAREHMAATHWEAFLNSPLMGYGLGTFDAVNRSLLDAGNFEDLWIVRSAHNMYVTWLEQAGLIGALPMFACIVAILVITLRGTLLRSRMTHALFGLLCLDVVFLVHGVSDFTAEIYSMAMMWAYLLGVQITLSQGARRR